LKAVRVIYNIFLLSRSTTIQTVAQATLTQISTSIFNRIPTEYDFAEIMRYHREKLGNPDIKGDTTKMLADKFDDGEAFEERLMVADLETADPLARNSQDILRDASSIVDGTETDTDKVVKDAYLIFRAFCKLSMKAISGPDNVTDLRSQPMRSKLLSLSLVNIILRDHGHVFAFPSPILFTSEVQASKPSDVAFVIAVRQYICLVFTRNIVSIVPQVFDMSMEIFGKMLLDLRFLLKKEISVIFTQIIIPIIEASNPVTFYQRVSIMRMLQRIFSRPNGGKVLVELYLNYDCDMSTSPDENIWERLMNSLAQVMTSTFTSNSDSPQFDFKQKIKDDMPNITTSNLVNYTKEQVRQLYLSHGDGNELKTRCLEFLTRGVLASLTQWCKDRVKSIETPTKTQELETDDPIQFEMSKNKKVRLAEGIKIFNIKPKKAIKFLVDGKIIPSKAPRHVAHFLLHCPGLDKTMIGDYLGEGDEANVQTMHAFVDYMDFSGKTFVEALRMLLNTFRLPGEAQKIDRFMLKFAERYVNNNPDAFSSADTAYVLAYSVIMLNTDQYNPQVKKRMTPDDFIKNNRGIDEGKDLPPEFLQNIFDEIKQNEIKLKDENVDVKIEEGATSKHQTKSVRGANNRARGDSLISTIKKNNGSTRDPSSLDSQFVTYDSSTFIEASNYAHIKPMFQLNWMSFLMSVSSFLQKSEDLDAIVISLEGFKHAIHICCLFDLELEKKGFFTNLSKFLDLPNLVDIKEKNIEACKTVLDIAYENGNNLGENWNAIVKMISELEKIHTRGMIEPDHTRYFLLIQIL
jgi:brefeldin A-inhibited guanine nucleotide-exchange protein